MVHGTVRFMRNARIEFENWAEDYHFRKPVIPIILNATAKTESHPSTIKHLVTWQLTSPVFWRESMDTLRDLVLTLFTKSVLVVYCQE